MKKKDGRYIANMEKAIAKKYGMEATINPKFYWNSDKEKDYLEQLKEAVELDREQEHKTEKVEINGVLISKKLLNKETERKCPVCSIYSFDVRDDVYMSKYDCCWKCYIQHVEDREERWQSGWRPESTKKEV
tara:strand:- start:832 stop:1227 length:396 start_codon:yes stop_codon:yes gene_type:complete